MSSKSLIISILLLLVLAGVFVYLVLDKKEVSTTGSSNIVVDNLSPGDLITSPLELTGQARTWYFEASFPIRLLDGNGNVIATVPAQAQGDWMTTDFVPFKATLIFTKPATDTGTLVFHNDNPSGLPEHDEEVRIPIRFK